MHRKTANCCSFNSRNPKQYSSVPLTACLSPLLLDLFHMALKVCIAAHRQHTLNTCTNLPRSAVTAAWRCGVGVALSTLPRDVIEQGSGPGGSIERGRSPGGSHKHERRWAARAAAHLRDWHGGCVASLPARGKPRPGALRREGQGVAGARGMLCMASVYGECIPLVPGSTPAGPTRPSALTAALFAGHARTGGAVSL